MLEMERLRVEIGLCPKSSKLSLSATVFWQGCQNATIVFVWSQHIEVREIQILWLSLIGFFLILFQTVDTDFYGTAYQKPLVASLGLFVSDPLPMRSLYSFDCVGDYFVPNLMWKFIYFHFSFIIYGHCPLDNGHFLAIFRRLYSFLMGFCFFLVTHSKREKLRYANLFRLNI